MLRYLLHRLLIAIPVLFGVTIIAFTALSFAPGDPLTARIDPSILAQQSPEWITERRHALGLDQPLPIRYVKWLAGALQGDLGFSVVTHRPIADELALRLPVTRQLMGAALLVGLLIGIPAPRGIHHRRPGRGRRHRTDHHQAHAPEHARPAQRTRHLRRGPSDPARSCAQLSGAWCSVADAELGWYAP